MNCTDIEKIRKPTKTISGVTPLAVVIKPMRCKHGRCLYCPSLNVPQSYTPESPAIIRAKELSYNPYNQVKARLEAFRIMRHPTDKIELIIMGGTFLSYPEPYQDKFIKRCYDALNNKESRSLDEAKRINETLGNQVFPVRQKSKRFLSETKNRCVALCIETRPDVCSIKDIQRMLKFGCTRVELGVQMINDEIYKKVNRGHTVKDVIEATKRLKNSGFKVGYHIMPGLPGSSIQKDINLFKKLFDDNNYKPDQVKIYPCQVIKGSDLERLYKKREYEPYTDKQLIELLSKLKSIVPEYCRIMRIMREIPPSYLVAGTIKIDLRNILEKEMKEKKMKCRCIRCREIGFALRRNEKIDENLKLETIEYNASHGKEFFLEFVNKDNILFGLCRLRIIRNKAFIRELHVFGQSLSLGKKPCGEKEIQHKGLGKRLMKEAEKISEKNKCNKIYVISGVGARDYYRRLGYVLREPYMVKKI